MSLVLLASVFVIATCGLVYELIAGALASYLLGDSITQFSTIIGVYLFSMGIGSYLSKFVHRRLLEVFIQVEILVGFIGGVSASLLFLAFEHVGSFRLLLYSLVVLTGMLVGLEIPLLMRILGEKLDLKDLVAKVFTFDYIGALLASLLFPLVLVPHLGLVRSAFMFGIFNVLVSLWALHAFREQLGRGAHLMRIAAGAVLLFHGAGFASAEKIMSLAESSTYADPVVFAKTSPYQRIVVTRRGDDVRLFLNGNLQFSSRDEYRYHEALVHVGMGALPRAKRVLVLGGGDGLAVRELLKYPSIESITLVDLDRAMTDLFIGSEVLAGLNGGALRDPRVRVENADAFHWLRDTVEKAGFVPFDFVVVDFPDPSNFSIGKLYSNTFFRVLYRAVNETGSIVVQSTSPLVARKSYWCVETTLASVGFSTLPYHAFVPSFGEWGFILAAKSRPALPEHFPAGLKFISRGVIETLVEFPSDMRRVDTAVNKLNNQVLVRYFEDEWSRYVQ